MLASALTVEPPSSCFASSLFPSRLGGSCFSGIHDNAVAGLWSIFYAGSGKLSLDFCPQP